MEVERLGIDKVLPDNEEEYFITLLGVIESRDDLASVQISKIANAYSFRIVPSGSLYTNPIIEEILNLNNKLGIRLDFSKSIGTSSVISFKILLA